MMPAITKNRSSNSRYHHNGRPLADILQDHGVAQRYFRKDTDWADTLAAIKTRGRRPSLLNALQLALCPEERRSTCLTVTSAPSDVDDDDESLDRFAEEVYNSIINGKVGVNPGADAKVGRSAIKGVYSTKTDFVKGSKPPPPESQVTDNDMEDPKIDDGKNAESLQDYHAPPPRRMPNRSGSGKGGSGHYSINLDYVLEDWDEEDLVDSDKDDDSIKKNKGHPLPPRRLPRGSSLKEASFRNGLRNVIEDAEDNMDHYITLNDNAKLVEVAEESRRAYLPARHLSRSSSGLKLSNASTSTRSSLHTSAGTAKSSLRTSAGTARSSLRTSAGTATRSSLCTSGAGTVADSIDMMAFGVNSFKKSMRSSGLSSDASISLASNTSALVDSDGFLPWGVDDAASVYSTQTRRKSDSSESSNSDASYSNLIDSTGFLGWGDNSTIHEENSQDDDDESSDGDYDSWEGDGESLDDDGESSDLVHFTETESKHTGIGVRLSDQMKRVASAVTDGVVAKRNSSNSDIDAPTIKTNDESILLVADRSSSERSCSWPQVQETDESDTSRYSAFRSVFAYTRSSSAPLPDNEHYSRSDIRINREDAFKPFFGNRRNSGGTSEPDVEYYSNPNICISREDESVDIGKMRRELCMAGSIEDNSTSNERSYSWSQGQETDESDTSRYSAFKSFFAYRRSSSEPEPDDRHYSCSDIRINREGRFKPFFRNRRSSN